MTTPVDLAAVLAHARDLVAALESHPGAGDAASPPLAGDPAPAVTP